MDRVDAAGPSGRFAPLVVALHLAVSLHLVAVSGCGPTASDPVRNPVPVSSSISPSTAARGGPGFTLNVTGSDFVKTSSVRWDGTSLATTYVGSGSLTAHVGADRLLTAGTHDITVVNPGPGGGTSASLTFTIPCELASPTPASSQDRARLGAYYFDGWAGQLSNFHFDGLRDGGF